MTTIERTEPIKLAPGLIFTAILLRLRSGDATQIAEAKDEVKQMIAYANDRQGPRGDFSKVRLESLIEDLSRDVDPRDRESIKASFRSSAERTLLSLVYYCGGLQGGWFGDKARVDKSKCDCTDLNAGTCKNAGPALCGCRCHSEAGA